MKCILTPRMAAKLAMLLMLFLTGSGAAADDNATYELLSEVSIGRVFFSPEQRELLDDRRRVRPVRRDARRQVKRSEKSAGYIVNSAGESRIYTNGDFVAADQPNDVEFPGKVSVVRQKAAPSTPANDENDTEPSDADD